jgi:hypothetical protein
VTGNLGFLAVFANVVLYGSMNRQRRVARVLDRGQGLMEVRDISKRHCG